MKPLPSTLRNKKRYIAFKIHLKGSVSKKEVTSVISEEAMRFYGELKSSEFGLWIVEYDEGNKTGFLVCNHRYKGEMIACLTLIKSIAGQEASIQVLGVSGTIRSLKRKFLKDDTDMSQRRV